MRELKDEFFLMQRRKLEKNEKEQSQYNRIKEASI
jgi:hypothetical protein